MDWMLQSFSSCLAGLELPYIGKFLDGAAPWRETTVTLGPRRLVVLKLIGEGGYSFVYKVSERTPSGSIRQYALKKVLVATGEQLATARQEVDVMRRLHHPNLLPLLDSAVTHLDEPDNPSQFAIYMLFPLYDQGSLMDEVMQQHQAGKALPPQTILSIFIQVCRGVHAMHTAEPQPLAHHDIKPHNVLLRTERRERRTDTEFDAENVPLQDDRGHGDGIHAVLMDFGSTRPARIEVTSRAEALSLQEDAEAHCSAPYRAPELFDVPSQCTVDERVDVWSLGCLLYFMMYAVSPFERVLGQTGGSLALAVANGTVQWPAEGSWSDSMRKLVLYCLTLDAQKRPSVDMVLSRAEAALQECRQDEG